MNERTSIATTGGVSRPGGAPIGEAVRIWQSLSPSGATRCGGTG